MGFIRMTLLEKETAQATNAAVDTGGVPTILVLIDYYLPGYKSGGPLRAVSALTNALGDEFHFKIITSDRDLREKKPYARIQRNRWTRVGKAEVMYVNRRNPFAIARHLLGTPHDVMYVQSFFSRPFSILPMWLHALGMLRTSSIVVAPSGEFSPGALAIRKFRKRLYISVARRLSPYQRALWHASSDYEAKDVKRALGPRVRIVTALHLVSQAEEVPSQEMNTTPASASKAAGSDSGLCSDRSRPVKTAGTLRAVFLSRIARMKNLDGALSLLQGLRGNVIFDLYGPLEDPRYWEECEKIIAALPATVRVRYRGSVPHEQVGRILSGYDLFLFPTLGENFGYVIIEALLSGCPVLISDQTRWRSLERAGVGWDLPLDQPQRFREALQRCIDMSAEEHRALSARAQAYGLEQSRESSLVSRSRILLQTALAKSN